MRGMLCRPHVALSRRGIPRPAGAGIVKRKRPGFRYTRPKKINRKPGFDAFIVSLLTTRLAELDFMTDSLQVKEEIEDEDGNMVKKIEVVAPGTGIHVSSCTARSRCFNIVQ